MADSAEITWTRAKEELSQDDWQRLLSHERDSASFRFVAINSQLLKRILDELEEIGFSPDGQIDRAEIVTEDQSMYITNALCNLDLPLFDEDEDEEEVIDDPLEYDSVVERHLLDLHPTLEKAPTIIKALLSNVLNLSQAYTHIVGRYRTLQDAHETTQKELEKLRQERLSSINTEEYDLHAQIGRTVIQEIAGLEQLGIQ